MCRRLLGDQSPARLKRRSQTATLTSTSASPSRPSGQTTKRVAKRRGQGSTPASAPFTTGFLGSSRESGQWRSKMAHPRNVHQSPKIRLWWSQRDRETSEMTLHWTRRMRQGLLRKRAAWCVLWEFAFCALRMRKAATADEGCLLLSSATPCFPRIQQGALSRAYVDHREIREIIEIIEHRS